MIATVITADEVITGEVVLTDDGLTVITPGFAVSFDDSQIVSIDPASLASAAVPG